MRISDWEPARADTAVARCQRESAAARAVTRTVRTTVALFHAHRSPPFLMNWASHAHTGLASLAGHSS
jgi:hypothetical protein